MGIFKAGIGGTIGFFVGGPLGALVGAGIGLASNGNTEEKQGESQEEGATGILVICPYCEEKVNIPREGDWICPYCKKEFVFGESDFKRGQRICFSMYAKFSKINGIITNEHIKVIENLIENEYQYSEIERKNAIDHFRNAKDDDRSIEEYAYEFKKNVDEIEDKKTRENIYIEILNYFYMIGNRTGNISSLEVECIKQMARIFELNEIIVESILSEKTEEKNKLYKYYEILNCKYGDEFEIVKRNYKKLAREYHPDRIASAEIPEYLKEHSYEKFREIQEAYDYIKNI